MLILLVCAGVALAQVGIGLAARNAKRPSWLRVSRPVLTGAAIAIVLVGASVAVAAGLPAELSDRWEEFKGEDEGGGEGDEGGASAPGNRSSLSGSGRYQFWQSAVDANETEPLTGIGPGTFEFWWARDGTYSGFIRDAHSLYMETLGELGIIGFVLIVGFSLAVLIMGAVRCWRAPPDLRLGLAAAVAGAAAFVGGAMVDWIWELGVFGLVFMVLAAIAVAGGRPARGTAGRRRATLAALGGSRRGRRRLAGRDLRDHASPRRLAGGHGQPAGRRIGRSPGGAREGRRRDRDRALRGDPLPAEGAGARAARPAGAGGERREAGDQEGVDQLEDLARALAARGGGRKRPAAVDAYLEGRRLNPRSGIFGEAPE